MNEFVTVREACEISGIERHNFQYLIKKGKIQTERVSRKLWPEANRSGMPCEITGIRKTELERFMNSLKTVQCAECDGSGVAQNMGRCSAC